MKILIVSDKNSRIRQLNLNRFWLLIFTLVIFAGTGSGIYYWFDDFTNWFYKDKLEQLQSDNSKLIEKIVGHEKQIEELKDQLGIIKLQDDHLREFIKLPKIHDDIRKVGVGGKKNLNESNLNYLLPKKDIKLEKIQENIDFLQRWINLEQLSYAEIQTKIDSNFHQFRAYPAVHPVDINKCKFSSGYGMRRDPVSRTKKFHYGHDFSARTGTKVYVTADGKTTKSLYFGTFGNYIEIDHGYGYKTIYGHLSKRKVKKGEMVKRGQMIGTVGNTGKSTAPHLHYEIKYYNKNVDPTDYYFDLPLN